MSKKLIKVLLADDDEAVRLPAQTVLEDHGFEVTLFANDTDLEAGADGCDVWVIDVRLPSGNYEGILAVYSLVTKGIKPRAPILFTSVDSEANAQKHLAGLESRGVKFEWLQKPFEYELLLERVMEIASRI